MREIISLGTGRRIGDKKAGCSFEKDFKSFKPYNAFSLSHESEK
jgi:hypothetical protein